MCEARLRSEAVYVNGTLIYLIAATHNEIGISTAAARRSDARP